MSEEKKPPLAATIVEGKVVHVASAEVREGIGEFNQDSICCGQRTQVGHGLAGGGFGIYTYCETCGRVVTKTETPD